MNQNLGTINVDAICIGDTDSERMHKIEQVSNITGNMIIFHHGVVQSMEDILCII